MTNSRPLCVDLDGTLVEGDTIWQGVRTLCLRRPHLLPLFPWWLRGGRAAFKQSLFCRVEVQPHLLRFHHGLIAALMEERGRGRHLILVTGADQSVADALRHYVCESGSTDTAASGGLLFHEALGSDGARNLTGPRKAAELVRRYGEKGFDYAGNSRVDLPVWARTGASWVVAKTLRDPLIAQARAVSSVERVFTWDAADEVTRQGVSS